MRILRAFAKGLEVGKEGTAEGYKTLQVELAGKKMMEQFAVEKSSSINI